MTEPLPALHGIRVISMGQILAAPYCSTLLGEFGAEVIKVEQPGIGDPNRDNVSFTQDNRGQKAVTMDRQEALDAVKQIMIDQAFGASGNKIIIEECLHGHEASILAIVDGNTILTLEASQDHKRAQDGDAGPNTGGMGAYCPTPLINLTKEGIVRLVTHACRTK